MTYSVAGPCLTPGTRLGRYSIVEPIGVGGMGAVYRARDEKLERVAAIKMLVPGVFSGDEARRRFRREALALAKLNHPHIAAVYDVGEQAGIDYIVMECVAGESLAAKVKRGPLVVEEATSIALEIAQALEEAHEHGVIHRDLKPANVMITPKGQAKVLDFGVAKLLEPTNATQSLETTALIGTPLYMSPEHRAGQRYTPTRGEVAGRKERTTRMPSSKDLRRHPRSHQADLEPVTKLPCSEVAAPAFYCSWGTFTWLAR